MVGGEQVLIAFPHRAEIFGAHKVLVADGQVMLFEPGNGRTVPPDDDPGGGDGLGDRLCYIVPFIVTDLNVGNIAIGRALDQVAEGFEDLLVIQRVVDFPAELAQFFFPGRNGFIKNRVH